ncbi:DNA ligase-associated DEXH box helicase [Rhodothalassium salexigens]|uniref:ligase-associated DNA damage response DEXH box helicase n=1 Tax=Rhodothalassium salexigens TaxID=1086 RepID=UPI001912F033|nr:ligase-associated DNA damage response DEXH box helicase [Rhodothalassium salexigens]MBK5921522.1 DNA ligase-associated DEXH box helicase [Rhodothalassium salexigens]
MTVQPTAPAGAPSSAPESAPGRQAPPALPEPIAGWLAARGWSLHGHQRALLATPGHALLLAPTGAGKTLAGFLPSLKALIERPRDGLHTLYVSPLKALAADVARNIERPVAEMGVAIRAETRTGDTPQPVKDRQRRDPPQILLTTPESLALLLSSHEAARLFAGLERIVIDEVHAFAPTKRGQLLSLGLARLARLAPAAARIGLSATVRDVDAHRRWLAPGAEADRVALVSAPPGPAADIQMMVPQARIPWSGHTGRHALAAVYDQIKAHRTTLVFVNTRSIAERVFQDLWALNEDGLEIALHHGSLARDRRVAVEAAMARGGLRAVVCTASLDLGLDWGDVDLVVQLGAPKGASRLVQRIGRANHRFDQPSKALLVPGNRFEYLEAQAALDAVRAGELDGEPFGPGGLDVLAQHILGCACAAPVCADALYDEVRQAAPYAALSRADFDDAFDYVVRGGYALRRYNQYRRLVEDEQGRWRALGPKVVRQYRMNAGTIVDAPVLEVKFKNGRVLGTVEEWFALGLSPGDTFMFAGQVLAFEALDQRGLIVAKPRRGAEPMVPIYAGARMPLSTHLADRVRAMLADRAGWQRFAPPVRQWLAMQARVSDLPGPDDLLVETFPRGLGERRRHYLVAYCFEGRNAHQTLGMLVTKRLDRLGLRPMGFVATDYVLAVWSLDPVAEPAALFAPDILVRDLADWMAETSMLKRTFREVSTIAGLIDKKHPGAEKTGRQVTFNADLIYDVLRKYDPDHVLLRATWADASGRLTDLDRLRAHLERIEGRIRHRALARVSPLAVPVLLEIGREQVSGAHQDAHLVDAEALIAEATDGLDDPADHREPDSDAETDPDVA